jgi:glutamate N-acetyltransferase/amino-acid N-acetyltransferase
VVISKRNLNAHVQPGKLAILVNSGCANACTGKRGIDVCKKTIDYLANKLELEPYSVFPSSTGEILKFLSEERMLRGIDLALENKSSWIDFASAIMTTDTKKKLSLQKIELEGETYSVFGVAKGSGMISPNMATMLAYIFTDLNIELKSFNKLVSECCNKTFNTISVDGETSTNDSILAVCSAADQRKDNQIFDSKSKFWKSIQNTFESVCLDLSEQIISDGEGASKVIKLRVKGATSYMEADNVARGVGNSPLVKTAFFAEDPNFGRILSAIGANASAVYDPNEVSVSMDGYVVIEKGVVHDQYNEKISQSIMRKDVIDLEIVLGCGESESSIIFCDLSYDYVKINSEYRT